MNMTPEAEQRTPEQCVVWDGRAYTFRGRDYVAIADDEPDGDGVVYFLVARRSFEQGRPGLRARYVVYPEGVVGNGRDYPCRCRVIGTAHDVVPAQQRVET